MITTKVALNRTKPTTSDLHEYSTSTHLVTRTSTGTECACTAGFDLGLVDLLVLDLGPCQCTSTSTRTTVRYTVGLLSDDDDVPSRAVLVPDVVIHSHGTALAIM